MPQTLELELPYQEITSVANQKELRTLGFTRGKETYFVPYDKLQIREGFNVRKEYEDEHNTIQDLANFIYANGLPEPLRIDVLKDGTTYVESGHRRKMALDILHKTGLLLEINKPGIRNGEVECFINDNNVDELTRIKRQRGSNAGKKFTSLEDSELAKRLEVFFRMTQQEIGMHLGMSRQTVKNLLIIAEQSDVVKQAIGSGKLTPTAAIGLARTLKDSDKVTEKVQEAVSSGKAITVSDVKKIQGEVPDEPLPEGIENNSSEDADNNSEEKQLSPLETISHPNVYQGGGLAENSGVKEEKEVKFDESREEIVWVQKVIQNSDKINSIITKLVGVPDQTKADINQLVEWNQRYLADIRDWISKNKKFNKAR